MFKNIKFILHKPQLSENIGACARAMKNFNIRKLSIVDPKPNFPNDKIIATSVGANDLIKNTKTYKTLEEAIQNSDYVVSTTARFRNKNLKHITINDLNKIDFKKKIAFVFGSEASGLSNKEISFSNFVLQIPTNSKFKSLNLSHGLIIVAQKIFEILNSNKNYYDKSKKIKKASKKQIQAMANLCIKRLELINFFKPEEKKPIMLENLRMIFYKMDLSEKEIRILSSVFATLSKKG
jgi:tRNA/rRNA methyltransferase|tara:strand:+ start:7485 stop:8195 length:711 start_codon:yes stop_codon:yes gene_type:complete